MPPVLRSVSKAEWAGLGLVAAAAVFLRFWQPDLGFLSLHTSRDLYRSLLLLRGVEFPLLGSELQYGGRVLGPLMYVLCAIPLSVSMSPVGVALFIAAVNMLLLGGVWWFVRSWWGPGAAFWSVAFYAVFPLEIAQLRFNWNPCFLPLLATGAWVALLEVAVRRRPWHVVTLAVFIALGLQLHISAAEMILSAGLVLWVARPRIPWRAGAVAGLAVLMLFTPLIVHELTAKTSDLAQVVRSPESYRPWYERLQFNPNGTRNFFYHVRLQMHERGETLGFAYLQIVPLLGERWLGPVWMRVAGAINGFAQIQLLFWVVGVWVCIREVRRAGEERPGDRKEASASGDPGRSRDAGKTGVGEAHAPVAASRDVRAQRALYLSLLIWQVVPLAILSVFNYHGNPGEPPTLAPIRYYLVMYPAPFVTSALGLVAVARWAAGGRRGAGVQWRRRVVSSLGVFLLLAQATFAVLYLRVLERSGRMVPYQWPNAAPTLRSMTRIRDILLGDAKINREAWFRRVHARRLGTWSFGEATFDFLITQDPRSVTNPPPDPHLRWMLFSPFKEDLVPAPPEGATESRRWTLGDTGMAVLEYRVEDPDTPVPDNKDMRNYYYVDDHMVYLGPEPELRREGRGG